MREKVMPPAEYLSVRQAAAICGVNRASVLAWIEGHNLPAVRPVPGGAYRIPRTGLEGWLAARSRGDENKLSSGEQVRFKKETNELFVTMKCGYQYPVDLDETRTAGGVLDWIMHLAEKDIADATFREFVNELKKRVDVYGLINSQK